MTNQAIKHDIDLDLDLWRYMSIDKFALLMSRRRLWFARGDLLGDEHEGSMPNSIIDERRQRLDDSRVEQVIESGSKAGRKYFFVSCWSMQDPKLLSMWKIYTPNATGVAVKTTVRRLASCFASKLNDGVFNSCRFRIAKASYINYAAHKATPDAFDPFTHKQEAYYYEKEIRAILSYVNMQTVDELPMGIELIVDLDVLIDEIYVSHLSGDGLADFVNKLLQENNLTKTIAHPSFVKEPRY